jgi:hypothetical protein
MVLPAEDGLEVVAGSCSATPRAVFAAMKHALDGERVDMRQRRTGLAALWVGAVGVVGRCAVWGRRDRYVAKSRTDLVLWLVSWLEDYDGCFG